MLQRRNKLFDHTVIMHGAWGEPRALRATRNSWIVDRLHVDTEVFEQHIARLLAGRGITNMNWHDVADGGQLGQVCGGDLLFQQRGLALLGCAFLAALL